MIVGSSDRDGGFSLVELLVAVAILMSISALLFHFVARGQRLGRSQPDAADLQQRVRVAAGAIQRDLSRAGAGLLHGTGSGPLVDYFAPVVPARTGMRTPDPELTWHPDRLSVVYVPHGGWHARLSADMPGPGADVPIDSVAPGCPAAGLCGFTVGTRAAIVETSALGAGYDLFTVTANSGGLGHAQPFSRAYTAAAAVVMPVVHHVYYLDRPNRRLMLYDGNASDLPLVDNVVDLGFTYFADPQPASARWPAMGESNCAYAAGDPPVPLLSHLVGLALRPLSPAELTDGPFCGLPPNRFDADLLRIRRVRVTLRVQVAADELRGAGPAFSHAGTSGSGDSYVPDLEVTFDVAPRNLRPTR